jgi:hypothetical protein
MKAYEQTLSLLDGLQLRGIRKRIDEEINEAETQKTSYLGFLNYNGPIKLDKGLRLWIN